MTTADRIRVLVVDDQTIVRDGIVGLLRLSERIDVIGSAADGRKALDALDIERPDVILLDLRMPVLDGIAVLRELGLREDPPPCLVLTTFQDDEQVLQALRAGARGYLLKDVSLDDLVAAVEIVAAGGSMVASSVTQRLLDRLGSADTAVAPVDLPVHIELTTREREVLRMLVGGFSNKEIASAMHLAPGTVKNHVSTVLAKLGVRDRTRAVLRALELDLV
ncbi:DNA-binding response regulator [Flexivirga endophytica]|uniref:DNA-binding response regulator n=1 Tax=Flexivirga endophytica TaxID=1849103 RepID=A0A916SWA0_9MICO|nr:response regulator transcription factor [Flexivirga endophytica]GGB16972.1 DNA-binding response regulator [Flexivirga endophytica]GHB38582.1 DNA-binding response regulator [Flexivirga endophytica]